MLLGSEAEVRHSLMNEDEWGEAMTDDSDRSQSQMKNQIMSEVRGKTSLWWEIWGEEAIVNRS